MRILLIYPYSIDERIDKEDISTLPIGIYYIGAMLKENGHDVELVNGFHFRNRKDGIAHLIRSYRPDVIGFSIVHGNRWGAIEIAQAAKDTDPGIITVMGGIGATFLWRHLLTHFSQIDYIVLNEAEYAFLDLIQNLGKKDIQAIRTLPGIALRTDNGIVKNKPAKLIACLDNLPNPAKYFTYQHVVLTRGCRGNCRFCGSPGFWKRQIRFHSSRYFVEQIEMLHQRGVNFFYVSDDTFTADPQKAIEVCQRIIDKRLLIQWAAISRIDCIDTDLLYWMRKAGCIQISYGVESGSAKIRDQLNKGILEDQIVEVFHLTTHYGILPRAYFIYGCPGEDWQTIDQTIELINKIRPLSVIFYILTVFPGTAMYARLKKRLKLTDDYWLNKIEDILYFEIDPALNKDLVLSFGQKLRQSFYTALPEFINKIDLIDCKDLYECHADFCSRLAMTFTHGDYANIDAIADKDRLALLLYDKSLSYAPNHRAYLGIGMLKQKAGLFESSVAILKTGLSYYPQSEFLNLCLGVSYVNLKHFEQAQVIFDRYPYSDQAIHYSRICQQALKKS